jgi:hypothetical protein
MSNDKANNTLLNYRFSVMGLNPEKKYYDLEENKDPINYKPRTNSKNEFGIEYEKIIPFEGEVRLLGNRHRDCRYFSLGKLLLNTGLELCKQRVVDTNTATYLPCKNAIDAMYRCYTEEKYGNEYHKTLDGAKPYANKFFDCYFHRANSLTKCMIHFEDSIRAIYRSPDNKLIDYY